MSDIAIRVEGLSEWYKIGPRERYKALRDVLTDAFAALFRRLRDNSQFAIRNPQWKKFTSSTTSPILRVLAEVGIPPRAEPQGK